MLTASLFSAYKTKKGYREKPARRKITHRNPMRAAASLDATLAVVLRVLNLRKTAGDTSNRG